MVSKGKNKTYDICNNYFKDFVCFILPVLHIFVAFPLLCFCSSSPPHIILMYSSLKYGCNTTMKKMESVNECDKLVARLTECKDECWLVVQLWIIFVKFTESSLDSIMVCITILRKPLTKATQLINPEIMLSISFWGNLTLKINQWILL